jgi:hypothetical protein
MPAVWDFRHKEKATLLERSLRIDSLSLPADFRHKEKATLLEVLNKHFDQKRRGLRDSVG